MTYKEAVAYLYSLEEQRINLGLARVKTLLSLMDVSPDKLNVIHVGGTNGKGSVAEMASSILACAGFRVGVYTSPHLKDFRERIVIKERVNVSTCQSVRVKREMIPKKALAGLVKEIRPLADKIAKTKAGKPTFFEVTTAAMFAHFAREKVDFAVIEVGLGGRLDATNVVDPLVSVITNIGLEHTDRLGNTLEKIAFEKCGIIKQGRPVITADTNPGVLKVMERICRRRNTRLIKVRVFVGQAFSATVIGGSASGGRLAAGNNVYYTPRGFYRGCEHFDYHGIRRNLKNLAVPLAGAHQPANASCALAALELINPSNVPPSKIGGQAGRRTSYVKIEKPDTLSAPMSIGARPRPPIFVAGGHLTPYTVRNGLLASRWPVRSEIAGRNPLVVLDGAHNPPAALALAKTIKSRFKYRELILVLGILRDKDVKGVLENMLPIADIMIFTKPESPRASDPLTLTSLLPKDTRRQAVFCIPDPRQAFCFAQSMAGRKDLILVAGSLYLAGLFKDNKNICI